ncbi:MAG: hypothetical protein AB1896_21075 [Thermodesulfobacteriota bacterium]
MIFLIRAAAAVAAAYFVHLGFFGQARAINVVLLAAFLVLAAYGLEALRRRGK